MLRGLNYKWVWLTGWAVLVPSLAFANGVSETFTRTSLLLAVLASVLMTGEVAGGALLWIIAKALLFFGGALLLGQKVMPGVVHIISLNKHSSVWTGFALCLALGFAQLALLAGLAPLIGAFFAGLLLDDVDFRVGDALVYRPENCVGEVVLHGCTPLPVPCVLELLAESA